MSFWLRSLSSYWNLFNLSVQFKRPDRIVLHIPYKVYALFMKPEILFLNNKALVDINEKATKLLMNAGEDSNILNRDTVSTCRELMNNRHIPVDGLKPNRLELRSITFWGISNPNRREFDLRTSLVLYSKDWFRDTWSNGSKDFIFLLENYES